MPNHYIERSSQSNIESVFDINGILQQFIQFSDAERFATVIAFADVFVSSIGNKGLVMVCFT